MCSNGPVVGIVPQRLLFETSLEKESNFINLPSSTAENPKEHRGNQNLHHFKARNVRKFPWNWTIQMIIIQPPAKCEETNHDPQSNRKIWVKCSKDNIQEKN